MHMDSGTPANPNNLPPYPPPDGCDAVFETTIDGFRIHFKPRDPNHKRRTLYIAAIPIGFFGITCTTVGTQLHSVSLAVSVVTIAVGVITVLAAIIAILAATSIGFFKATIVWNGRQLQMHEPVGKFAFDCAAIAGIRHVLLCKKSFAMDLRKPWLSMGRWVRIAGIDVVTADGAMRFLREWGSDDLAWARKCITHLTTIHDAGAWDQTTDFPLPGPIATPNGFYTGRAFAVWPLTTFLTLSTILLMWTMWHGWRSSDWPTVEAVVVEVVIPDDKDHRPTIRYRYDLNRRVYYGDTFAVAVALNIDTVRRIVTNHPRGSRLHIHYNPNDPAESAIVVGVPWGQGMAAVALPMMLAFFLVWLRRTRPDPGAGALWARHLVKDNVDKRRLAARNSIFNRPLWGRHRR